MSLLVWNLIRIEPIVREADSSGNLPALIDDLGIHGIWLPQVVVLMDVRVVDTDAHSYLDHSPREVLNSAELEKRRKYVAASQERRAQFTPLCFSVDGMCRGEAKWFMKQLAEQLISRWAKPYSLIMG